MFCGRIKTSFTSFYLPTLLLVNIVFNINVFYVFRSLAPHKRDKYLWCGGAAVPSHKYAAINMQHYSFKNSATAMVVRHILLPLISVNLHLVFQAHFRNIWILVR